MQKWRELWFISKIYFTQENEGLTEDGGSVLLWNINFHVHCVKTQNTVMGEGYSASS